MTKPKDTIKKLFATIFKEGLGALILAGISGGLR